MKGPYWQTYGKETIRHIYIFDRKTDRVTRFCDGDGFDDPDSLNSVALQDTTIVACKECTRYLFAMRV